jgi:hypothetical protein
MKSILTTLTISVLLSACVGEKAPSVLEYIHDPVLMKENSGWCTSNPSEKESAKCANLGQTIRLVMGSHSQFFECIKPTGINFYDYKPNHECIDAKAKELNIK